MKNWFLRSAEVTRPQIRNVSGHLGPKSKNFPTLANYIPNWSSWSRGHEKMVSRVTWPQIRGICYWVSLWKTENSLYLPIDLDLFLTIGCGQLQTFIFIFSWRDRSTIGESQLATEPIGGPVSLFSLSLRSRKLVDKSPLLSQCFKITRSTLDDHRIFIVINWL